MRNMSFALTTQQVIDECKFVTRRLGWRNLKAGQQIRAVRKCMGLRKGEAIQVLKEPLTVVSVRLEPLRAMLDDPEYGMLECALEGFGHHSAYHLPGGFVEMFCATHAGCTPESIITRIEFAYPGGAKPPRTLAEALKTYPSKTSLFDALPITA